ncbi:hypothetical protein CPB83DRAFT_859285 [Crepidotus variabilis]|uniref:F-box domain-containing protein n=1 Tax=Crepidotus variabilis TaxID=179855 RepID=A0A9P6EAL9_9AGAR|nr:hypothetical protein CPB83DRAFT_859285 [Crepidotus variabilis]
MAAHLPRDILWRIFLYNAVMSRNIEWEMGLSDPSEPNALLVTRHQSQVCCYWRSIILNSPSIWRRMIHTRLLAQPSGNWRSEVLRRTQDSPLWVNAIVAGESDGWVTDILEDNWTRVEELHLYIDQSTPDLQKLLIRRTLLQPTSSLKSLTLRPGTQGLGQDLLFSTTESEAGSDAPDPFPKNMTALEFLRLDNAPETFTFRSAHAFLTLHTLFLRFSLKRHSSLDLLTTLARLPFLKIFGLRNDAVAWTGTFDEGASIQFPNLDLPNLRSLSLANNVFFCTTLLTHLKPNFTRNLHIKVTSRSLSTSLVETFLDSLRPHIEAYFNGIGRQTEQVVLSLGQPAWVSVSPKPNDFWAYFYSPKFFLHFSGSMPLDAGANPFRNCRFDRVKKLSLERRRPVEPHLNEFLGQFVHVESLNISILQLEDLAKSDTQSLLFPCLDTLVLDLHYTLRRWTKYESTTMASIFKWLNPRKHRHRKVKVINLGVVPRIRLEAGCLEAMEGLIVRWTNIDQSEHSEYICGSGSPELLHFPHLYFQNQCSLPEFANHSPEELRFAYLMFGREMSSADLLKSAAPDPSATLANTLNLLQISQG